MPYDPKGTETTALKITIKKTPDLDGFSWYSSLYGTSHSTSRQNSPEVRKKKEHPTPFYEAGINLTQKGKTTRQFHSNIDPNHQIKH